MENPSWDTKKTRAFRSGKDQLRNQWSEEKEEVIISNKP
jgi:hypothetical protein